MKREIKERTILDRFAEDFVAIVEKLGLTTKKKFLETFVTTVDPNLICISTSTR